MICVEVVGYGLQNIDNVEGFNRAFCYRFVALTPGFTAAVLGVTQGIFIFYESVVQS